MEVTAYLASSFESTIRYSNKYRSVLFNYFSVQYRYHTAVVLYLKIVQVFLTCTVGAGRGNYVTDFLE